MQAAVEPQQIPMMLTGSALRELGMKRALDHADAETQNWTERTLCALEVFCKVLKTQRVTTFVMEDFRKVRSDALPASPNAWGAITNIASRRGIIRWTGEFRNAKSLKTHAHAVRVWEIL